MWELDHKEGWELKNWCFQTVVLEKTLESLLDSKKINPEYLLEGLMLKLKLQYFGYLVRRANSLEKILMVGKIKGRWKRGQQRMGWLDGIPDSIDMNWSNLQDIDKDREAWGAAAHGVSKSWTWFSDWITPVFIILGCHNKIHRKGWLKQQVCRLENSRSKWGWFYSWLGLSWLAEGHPLPWPFLGAVLKKQNLIVAIWKSNCPY